MSVVNIRGKTQDEFNREVRLSLLRDGEVFIVDRPLNLSEWISRVDLGAGPPPYLEKVVAMVEQEGSIRLSLDAGMRAQAISSRVRAHDLDRKLVDDYDAELDAAARKKHERHERKARRARWRQ